MSAATRIVIFDLGRVLMRICDGWQHACAAAGIAVPTGELDSTQDAALLDVVYRSEVGAIDQDTFNREVAPLLRLTPAEVQAISDAYLLGPYEGVPELLADMRRVGMKTACLSNTNANHWHAMTNASHRNRLPLEQLDYRFASQLMRLRKPDDAIYAAVERETALAGDAILFFDDLPENIAAAKRRGWDAVQISLDRDPIAQVRLELKRRNVLS